MGRTLMSNLTRGNFETAVPPDRAVLVGIETTEALDELDALCESCNIFAVGRVVQKIKEVDAAYYVGSGKVKEIAEMVQNLFASVVVFDVELSGSKVRNIESVVGVPVLDRSKVILDIFAQRASSAEGKLQVELAQLKYNLPRLHSTEVLSKMKNSVGTRGPGEKKLELDKRKIRDEIIALEKRLEKLTAYRNLAGKQAVKSKKPRVCLVGYTNSGKSTLHNVLAKSDVLAKDQLFATLDPKTSQVFIMTVDGGGVPILLTDTVGFINKLPHEFINAFESTLDSVRYADLLLHVVDASNPNYESQIAVVNGVLERIGASDIRTLLVFNKIDRLPKIPVSEKSAKEIYCSAKENINIDLLKEKIANILTHENNGLRRDE
jgi:GTP-binding protein HflX